MSYLNEGKYIPISIINLQSKGLKPECIAKIPSKKKLFEIFALKLMFIKPIQLFWLDSDSLVFIKNKIKLGTQIKCVISLSMGFKAIKGAILTVKTAYEASKIKHQHHQRKAKLKRGGPKDPN